LSWGKSLLVSKRGKPYPLGKGEKSVGGRPPDVSPLPFRVRVSPTPKKRSSTTSFLRRRKKAEKGRLGEPVIHLLVKREASSPNKEGWDGFFPAKEGGKMDHQNL